MGTLDIGEVCKSSGLPASTLRYYEEKGLIRSAGRHGLRRVFEQSILQRLTLISLGQEAGFSLTEIGSMFATDGKASIDRNKLSAKADELDKTIIRLTAMSDALRHAVACRELNHLECPKFQRILDVIGKRISRRHTKPKKTRAGAF